MDKGTAVRLAFLAVAFLNQTLVTLGFNPLPGTEESWGQVLSLVILGIAAAIAWFKNNYVTRKGKKQKEVLKEAGLTDAK